MRCGVPRPPGTGQALSRSASIDARRPERLPADLDLYRTDGAIDTVVLYTETHPA